MIVARAARSTRDGDLTPFNLLDGPNIAQTVQATAAESSK